MDDLSDRPRYDFFHLREYTTYIKLPHVKGLSLWELALQQEGKDTLQRVDCHANPGTALQVLTYLQKHHLAKVPFENLSLHYSPHHSVNLHPDILYDKIVKKGRGGYCMENNCFFGTVLRSLGFTVYGAGARVHEGSGIYTAWSHMVNIVTLTNGERYLIDAGFGNNGPACPLLLEDGHEAQSIPPTSLRLVREKIPATTNPNDQLWTYQQRISPGSDWEPMYSFTETEFLPRDYEMMNFWTSQSRKSLFTYRIMCVKKIIDEKSHELVGTLILTGAEVKRRVGEKTEHLKVCKTEWERVAVLQNMFDVRLTEEEREGIMGMVTQLPMTISE